MMIERNIGIIGDGPTDRIIFGKIVQVIMLNGQPNNDILNVIELERPTIRDHVDRYWREINSETDYYLPGKPAETLQNNVTNTLIGAFTDFQKEVGTLSMNDILLITTDSEKLLNNPERYFDLWAFTLSKILIGAIEKLYHIKVREGYPREALPVIFSLASFPSTEIFVAVAKSQKHFGKQPKELKNLVYGTDDLRTLHPNELQEKALDFITPQSINSIFSQIPESRLFIQTMSLGRVAV